MKSIPDELTALPQWLFWRYETRAGKSTKVPVTSMGYRASVTNPAHWSEYGYVVELLRKRPEFAAGIGFVFTPEDPYCGIDLDDVWRSDADEGAPWAWEIIERFRDTYAEESPSGTGLKIWCRAQLSQGGKKWPVEQGAIEIYDRGRFFCVTGRSNGIRVISDHQSDIDSLITYLGGNSCRVSVIGAKIPHGTQHHTLASLAGTMHRRGMTAAAIEAALQITNAEQCEQPGPPENIRRIVEDITRYPR